ncbi:inhibitory POU protein isoform X3 [Lutzomyia longipalpis]|uniref:inhibitory POU protein isoform X3 n=1 Tax=Lutzomyia longipalpis TaxID=7200 RepID=UPI0024833BC1|nr:inhibitory POU protein isoform X3 [Lutzomyia longipalpis]
MTMSMYPSPDKMKMGTPGCFPGRYSPSYRGPDQMRRCMTNPSGDIFSGLNDGILSRAEALAAVDIQKHQSSHAHTQMSSQLKHDVMYHHGMGGPPQRPLQNLGRFQMHHTMDGLDMLDPASSMTTLTPMSDTPITSSHHQLHGSYHGMNHMMGHHHGGPLSGHTTGESENRGKSPQGVPLWQERKFWDSLPGHHGHPGAHHPAMAAAVAAAGLHPDTDTDPRELEAFAERFKQRRIKLGVTQADVGKALANLKLPGVGALSQSTICRFESLTLSHNNMIALKPILQAWLEEAEAQAKNKRRDPDAPSVLPAGEKKRKRTSIAAPEKRSLEAYFAVQPRPSGEKIAAIAEKLDLKKNVVRVWFCNQRQKQKRMKFAAQH